MAKWVETKKGNFCDIEKAVILDVCKVAKGEYNVSAVFPASCGADNFPLIELLTTFSSETDARNYIKKLIAN